MADTAAPGSSGVQLVNVLVTGSSGYIGSQLVPALLEGGHYVVCMTRDAYLIFETVPQGGGRTRLRSSALFRPRGLMGRIYWWLLLPIHKFIFSGMNTAIRKRAAGRTGVVTSTHSSQDRPRNRSLNLPSGYSANLVSPGQANSNWENLGG